MRREILVPTELSSFAHLHQQTVGVVAFGSSHVTNPCPAAIHLFDVHRVHISPPFSGEDRYLGAFTSTVLNLIRFIQDIFSWPQPAHL